MFDESKIVKELNKLSFEKKLVFGASCCERLLPFYFAFHKFADWGDPQFLRDVLDRIWEVTESKQIPDKELAELLEKCDSMLPDPDTEIFSSPYSSQSLDACSAICDSLDFCRTKDTSFLGSVASVSWQAVEMYLWKVNDPVLDSHLADSQFDKWVETAPLLLAEIRHQQRDIKLLSENELEKDLIEKIRHRSSKSGVNPEKRGLL